MDGVEPSATRACKYVVARRLGAWAVTYNEASIGTFADATDASRFACEVARLEAQAGVPTIVVVQAPVMEMHCFTPPHAEAGGVSRLSPRLRVVQGGA